MTEKGPRSTRSFRLILEVAFILVAVESAIMLILPSLLASADGLAGVLLDAGLLALLAAPLILRRCEASLGDLASLPVGGLGPKPAGGATDHEAGERQDRRRALLETALVGLVVLGVAGVASYGMLDVSRQGVLRVHEDNLRGLAAAAATSLDPDHIQELVPTGGAGRRPGLAALERFATSQARLRSICLLRVEPDGPRPILVLRRQVARAGGPVGALVPAVDPAFVPTAASARALAGETVVGRPRREGDEELLTVHAPVRDRQGQVRALLVLELEAAGLRAAQDRALAEALAGLVPAGAIILAAMFAFHYFRRRLLGHGRQLARVLDESAQLAEIVRRTSNAVIITDRKGRVRWTNPAFSRLTGYTAEEVLGRKPGQVLQGQATDRSEVAKVASAIRRGLGITVELVNYRKGGDPYWVQIEIEPLRDPTGSVTGYMALELEVTERRLFEERLTESEARFRMLADTIPVMVWLADEHAAFTDFNRGWTSFRGRSVAQELGRGWAEGLHPDDREACLAALNEAWRHHRPFELQFRLRRLDGEYRTVESHCVPRHAPSGEFVGYSGGCFDVTERESLQAELVEAKLAAEAANRAKSEFLANMSHEIRTPLTAVLGYSELLGDDDELASDRDRREQTIETIIGAGRHLLAILNDVLDLSKIDAGRMAVEWLDVRLDELLRDVVAMIRARVESDGVGLGIEIETPLPCTIRSDPTRLRQILINLMGNAAKFTAIGRIILRARIVTDDRGREVLQLEVEDSGEGIPAEAAQRLFQPFNQADASVTRRHGGTGLGLTISRRLANLLDGDIVLVRSEPGVGSLFRIDLPLLAGVEGPTFTELPTARRFTDRGGEGPDVAIAGRLLLADDGRDNRTLISLMLRKAGAEVEVVENGALALAALDRARADGRPFDLLLTDVQMPEMDGLTLMRTLRDRGDVIPIVALTAHAMTEDRVRCLAAGSDAYASKPIDRRALVGLCARLLAEHRQG
ncbi:MAG: PAS domain S-box protein [Planctomycetes bacterium]|nr:PAS domain S-box protein [Planctomycetota bacterium]